MFPRDVQKFVKQAIAANKASVSLPAPGRNVIYTVHLPPDGVLVEGTSSSTHGLGGYHGSFKSDTGETIYFAVTAYNTKDRMPFPDGNGIPFSNDPRKNNQVVLSHELFETLTNPDVDDAKLATDLGWYALRNGGEAGDQIWRAADFSDAYDVDAADDALQLEPDPVTGNLVDAHGEERVKTLELRRQTSPHVALQQTPFEWRVTLPATRDMDLKAFNLSLQFAKPNGSVPTVTLVDPSGKEFDVAVPQTKDYNGVLPLDFGFLGERSAGTWTVRVSDPTWSAARDPSQNAVLKELKLEAKGPRIPRQDK